MRTVRARFQKPEGFRTGRFCRLRADARVITGDTKVETEGGHVALVFAKGQVPAGLCAEVYPALRKVATRSNSRAQAAGPLNARTLAKVRRRRNLVQINSHAYVNHDRRKFKTPGGYRYANSVQSGTVGWLSDKTVSKFTSDHFEGDYQQALRLAARVDARFARLMPGRHRGMARALEGRPRMSRAFTTMACNYNFRTALHRDNKTMPGSVLVFTLLGDDRAQGGLLTFPQLNVAVDLRVGDLLAFDAGLLHCNTPFRNKAFHRLSCVFYNSSRG